MIFKESVFVVSGAALIVAVVVWWAYLGTVQAQAVGECRWTVGRENVRQFPDQVAEGVLVASEECTIDISSPVPPDTFIELCTELVGARELVWNVEGRIHRKSCLEIPVEDSGRIDFTLGGLVPEGRTVYSYNDEEIILHEPQEFDLLVAKIAFGGGTPQEIFTTTSTAVTERYKDLSERWAVLQTEVRSNLERAISTHIKRGFLDQVDTLLTATEALLQAEHDLQSRGSTIADLQGQISELKKNFAEQVTTLEAKVASLEDSGDPWKLVAIGIGILVVLLLTGIVVYKIRLS